MLNSILKYVVSFAALFYIGYRIVSTNFSSADLYEFLNPFILFFIILLSFGNWTFEILKWKIVIQTFDKISFKKATYETLVAYTYGLITPFNSGNYFKKILFYSKEHSKKIVFLNLSKGIYQMTTTIIFGSWGIYYLIDNIDARAFNQQTFLMITSFIGLIVFILFRKKIIVYTKSIPVKVHFQLFLFSVTKFIFFSFLLMVLLHQNKLDSLQLYAGICAIYLLSSLLPILNILDFAIKGSMALFVLNPLGYSEANILIAYFILWICNHAAPAITGSFLQFYHLKREQV
ncbi:lysylphosphatidylglycerol synthase domain-containing protein [Wenyingzhuangia sp. IMCC45467]